MAFKMKYGKGGFPYKSKTPLKQGDSWLRRFRDDLRDDWLSAKEGKDMRGRTKAAREGRVISDEEKKQRIAEGTLQESEKDIMARNMKRLQEERQAKKAAEEAAAAAEKAT